jgi:hypothetical protein
MTFATNPFFAKTRGILPRVLAPASPEAGGMDLCMRLANFVCTILQTHIPEPPSLPGDLISSAGLTASD